jgi:hypothetical protein
MSADALTLKLKSRVRQSRLDRLVIVLTALVIFLLVTIVISLQWRIVIGSRYAL